MYNNRKMIKNANASSVRSATDMIEANVRNAQSSYTPIEVNNNMA